jgi:Kef-type K+ transport system membrane component KefB
MNTFLFLLDCVCLVMLIRCIYMSQTRWKAFGYAVLGFIIPMVLGVLASLVIGHESADNIGIAISIASPIAAVIGAGGMTETRKPA